MKFATVAFCSAAALALGASHGCVRLTNWDAVQLSKAVEKGTKVVFLGEAVAKA